MFGGAIFVSLTFLTFPITFSASLAFFCQVITKISPFVNNFALLEINA